MSFRGTTKQSGVCSSALDIKIRVSGLACYKIDRPTNKSSYPLLLVHYWPGVHAFF